MHKAAVAAMGFLLLWLLLPGSWALAATGWVYTVQPGDTIFRIGIGNGLSVRTIMQDNRLTGTVIKPGQKLWLRSDGGFSYRVRPGDTLYRIARSTKSTVTAIRRANGLRGTLLYPGQTLWIPARTTRTLASRSAQSQPSWTSSDLYLLARLVYAEARGEPYVGQVAVAAVVLNRLEHPAFPNRISQIIFQPGAFTAVADGQIYLTPDATAVRAARDALRGWDPTGGALYYWNPAKSSNRWVWSRTIVARYGNHVFAL